MKKDTGPVLKLTKHTDIIAGKSFFFFYPPLLFSLSCLKSSLKKSSVEHESLHTMTF